MATYPPPSNIEPITIFNPEYFFNPDTGLTQAQADLRYLRFPTAQGTENLQAINVGGLADFNESVVMGKSLTMNGTLDTDRIINNVYYQLQDKTSLGTTTGQIYGSAGTLIYDNDATSGSHNFYTTNSGGTQTNPLSLSSLNGATINTSNGASPSSSLLVKDTISNNSLVVIPNVSGGSYNASVDAGNQLILATSNVVDSEILQLTSWSSTNNYVKVRPTSVGMGAGGATSVATTSVECNGTSVLIKPSITFPDGKIQTSAFTGGVAGTYTNTSMTIDANGKISAISSGSASAGFISGMIVSYAGTSAPTGFLMCDGSQVSQTTYASLFAVIGTTYNTTTPSAGNFFLPDYRNRLPIGSQTTNPLVGVVQNGGLSNIVYNASIYNGNKVITNNQVAQHTHNLGWNTTNYVDNVNTTNNTTTGGGGARAVSGNSSAFPTASGGMANFFNFQGQGDYLPPVCSCNFIIKT